MRDPQGLCIRRNSFSHARSRVSRSKRSMSAGCNEIGPSDTNHELCQYSRFIADNESRSLFNNFRLDLAKNASASWLKNAIFPNRLEQHQPSGPPERSRSCNGRIEASSTYAKNHTRKLVSLCTDRPKVSRSNSLPEPGSDRQSRRSRYQEILDFSLCERLDGSAKEEKNRDALDEKYTLEDRIGKPDLVIKCENDNEKVTVLPLSVLAQKAAKTGISPVPLCAVLRKRPLEKEDEDIPTILNFKKPKGRLKLLKCPAGDQSTVMSLGIEKSDSTLKPSPSNFQASKWLSIDPSVFHFVSYKLTCSSHGANVTSSPMRLLEAQVRVKLEPSSFNAKSAFPTIKIEEQSHPNTRPTHFVSALDKFNEIIPGCDAMRRFQDKPNWCLANNQRGLRCGWGMRFKTQKVRQLLAELAELNIYPNMQECLEKLVAFTAIAVCSHQRDSIIWKLKSHLREDRSRSFAKATSTTADLPTERGRSADRSGTALIKPESGLNSERKERGIATPATTSAIKVTYWLRESPSQALHYLPEYRPYHPPELCPRSVREWVVEEAKKPLFIGDTGTTGKFRELDERMDGYLYVYWNRASFGLVKIGCTTVNVDQRLQGWENKCRHLAEEHHRSPFRIKHVARVEKLIHTEFREYRVFEPFCHGCGGKHIEWFRGLDLGFVIKRMEAWTEWIMKEPYEEKLDCWRLKDSPTSEIPQICATPDETENPKKGKASIVKEPPRYHLRHRRPQGSFQTPSPPTRT